MKHSMLQNFVQTKIDKVGRIELFRIVKVKEES